MRSRLVGSCPCSMLARYGVGAGALCSLVALVVWICVHDYGPPPPQMDPPDVCAGGRLRLLILGNSMSEGLDTVLRDVFLAAGCRNVEVQLVWGKGFSFQRHHYDLTQKHTSLYRLLGPGRREWQTWDYVILQDRSQYPGFLFSEDTEERKQYEVDGIGLEHLVEAAHAAQAQAILVVPWGARFGNKLRIHVYPTYTDMQDKLDAGCLNFQEQWAPTAVLAPAGTAFRWVLQQAGGDVHSQAFGELYRGNNDNRHPSANGTYLAALVIANTISGQCLEHGKWGQVLPMPHLLQAACNATLEGWEGLDGAVALGTAAAPAAAAPAHAGRKLHHEWPRETPH